MRLLEPSASPLPAQVARASRWAALAMCALLGRPALAADDVDAAGAGAVVPDVASLERVVSETDAAADWYRLGVARALEGDAYGAAAAFRAVAERAPAFPGIAERIQAAEARARRDAERSPDALGLASDPAARLAARRAAVERDDALYLDRVRAMSAASADGVDAWLIGEEAAFDGDLASASDASRAALDDDVDSALRAAEAALAAAQLDIARYYADMYEDFGGDAEVAEALRRRASSGQR